MASDTGPGQKPQYGSNSSAAKLWMLINVITCVFFTLAGLVQVNDQDPYVWMPVYLVPALLCFSIVWNADIVEKSWWRLIAIVHLIGCLICTCVLGGTVIHYMEDRLMNPLRYEEGRELSGVLIVDVWLIICLCRCCGVVKSGTSTGQISVVMWLALIISLMPIVFWGLCCFSRFNHCSDMW
ncbi:transmembrane protein 220-like [Strongylocentrotus purpuratus]|uniref:Transmembrane protein 220 n=1 Tax=Strongylocentrotus purpuratus TaxID=7668 RepID=A0A7M7PV18_STRPU|nr:transmembrane protein 220 [Strongylocentrotus purpuratus]XP_030855482.1 transmembrane protein 220-like [Strongylocentrotus purpuratus]|eukprot:XP_001196843.1 PREDICTED: transmembrane protein 220 [Strongylocentrotus purpuratus]